MLVGVGAIKCSLEPVKGCEANIAVVVPSTPG